MTRRLPALNAISLDLMIEATRRLGIRPRDPAYPFNQPGA